MEISEAKIQADIMEAFGAVPYMRIWRVNTGKGYGLGQVKQLIAMVTRAAPLQVILAHVKTMRPLAFGVNGHSDIGGVMNDGMAIFIEVKTRLGKQRPDQITFQKMVEKKNGMYILARSVEDVRAYLKERWYPCV